MSDFGVTPRGFVKKRLDTIISELQSDLTTGFGFDVTLNPQSFINVLITEFSDKFSEMFEVAEQNYHAMYPTSAEGVNLDNAGQFGGITREISAGSQYTILCTGTDGTVIPVNTRLSSNTNPRIYFRAPQNYEITRNSFNIAGITVVSALPNDLYLVTINGATSTYQSSDGDTAEDILQGLLTALQEMDNEDFTFEINDDALVVRDVAEQRSNTLALSSNLTTGEVSTLAVFISEDYGEVVLPVGAITGIVTNVPGFDSCVNVGAPILGRIQETDIEFRHSYIRKSAHRSARMTDSIESAIMANVRNVLSAKCYENDTLETDSEGRPRNTIEVVVDGGLDAEIAAQILRSKAGGIPTLGDVAVEVPDLYGNTITIRFNRPETVYIWLRVTLESNPAQPTPPNYVELTKTAIIYSTQEYGVGEAFLSQSTFAGINRNVSGLSYISVDCFATTDPNVVPSETDYTLRNVFVSPRQKMSISEDRIEVVLNE